MIDAITPESLPDLSPKQRDWLERLVAFPVGENSEHLYELTSTAGAIRLRNLGKYLKVIAATGSVTALIGEAPGYRGTTRTGIPFMSEAHVQGQDPYVNDRFAHAAFMLLPDATGRREATSSVMWRTLAAVDALPYLWAVYPHHPHEAGDRESNRRPTMTEITSARDLLVQFIDAFEIANVIAVGQVAAQTLNRLSIDITAVVRHPSRGGAADFRMQLAAVYGRTGRRG